MRCAWAGERERECESEVAEEAVALGAAGRVLLLLPCLALPCLLSPLLLPALPQEASQILLLPSLRAASRR